VPPASVDHRYLAGMDLLDNVIVTLSAFSGLLTENTTRGLGWVFLEIGRRMERALQTAELLSSGLASAPSDLEPHLQVLLQIADSSITYRRRYPTVVQAESVLEVLMMDETNPRAVAFQLVTLLQQVDRLRAAAMAFFRFYDENPRDLDLGFYLFRGGMKPHGLGKKRDMMLNTSLEAALHPIFEAAQELGASAEAAKLLMVDTFAHAAGLLLLAHTGRIRMFGVSASNLMERFMEGEIAALVGRKGRA